MKPYTEKQIAKFKADKHKAFNKVKKKLDILQNKMIALSKTEPKTEKAKNNKTIKMLGSIALYRMLLVEAQIIHSKPIPKFKPMSGGIINGNGETIQLPDESIINLRK